MKTIYILAGFVMLLLSGCNKPSFVSSQQLQSMENVIEISVWESDGWREGSKLPSNMNLVKSTTDSSQIESVIKVFRNVQDGQYATQGKYHLCFKDAKGQMNCTNIDIDWDCNRKSVWGTFFIDESGKLFDVLQSAGLIPPCMRNKPLSPSEYPQSPPR